MRNIRRLLEGAVDEEGFEIREVPTALFAQLLLELVQLHGLSSQLR
jgi:hypothetical protein